jgi:hypothetical protein
LIALLKVEQRFIMDRPLPILATVVSICLTMTVYNTGLLQAV